MATITGIEAKRGLVDILVDGRFEIGLRDLTLLYRGSSNQRLIDLAAMRAAGDPEQVILCNEEEL